MAVMHRDHELMSYLTYSISEIHAIEEPDTCLGSWRVLLGSKPPASFSLPSPFSPLPPPPPHHHSAVT